MVGHKEVRLKYLMRAFEQLHEHCFAWMFLLKVLLSLHAYYYNTLCMHERWYQGTQDINYMRLAHIFFHSLQSSEVHTQSYEIATDGPEQKSVKDLLKVRIQYSSLGKLEPYFPHL